MLKKKHDEAKELMVRAVVINNKLLMLNHPMIEEKISFCLYDLFFLVPRYASMFIWTLFLDRQNIRALQRLAASLQSKDYWKTWYPIIDKQTITSLYKYHFQRLHFRYLVRMKLHFFITLGKDQFVMALGHLP